MRLLLFTLAVFVLGACTTPAPGASAAAPKTPVGEPRKLERRIALTFDDAPYVGRPLELATSATRDHIEALDAAGAAPASVFVEGRRVEVEGEEMARRELLR